MTIGRRDRDKLATEVRARMERAYATGRDGRDKLRADVKALLAALAAAEAEVNVLYARDLAAVTDLGGEGRKARLIVLLDRETGGEILARAERASTETNADKHPRPPALDRPGAPPMPRGPFRHNDDAGGECLDYSIAPVLVRNSGEHAGYEVTCRHGRPLKGEE